MRHGTAPGGVDIVGPNPDREQPHVLIVDDDRESRKLHSRILAAAEIDAVVAVDGKSALEYARAHNVSLMLLDRRMPGMNGIQVLEHLREDPRTKGLPVILLTGVDETAALVQGLDTGADDYLTKPIRAPELVARVRAIMRGREGEAEIRRVVESANDAYISFDPTGLIDDWNARAVEMFGWERHEVLGRSFTTTVVAPDDRGLHEERMRRLADGVNPLAGEWLEVSAVRSDGGRLPVEMTVWSVGSGCTVSFHALLRDLSGRRDVENAFDQETLARELLDGGTDMITLTDGSGLFYASPACRTILGFEPGELVAIFDLVHPDDQEETRDAHNRSLLTQVPFRCSCRVRTRAGPYVWLEARGRAVRRGTEPTPTIHTAWRDVSNWVRVTEDRARAASVLEAANETLVETVDREHRAIQELQRLDRTRAEFVTTASHELRTPLASIMGYAELLGDARAETPDSEQDQAVRVITRNAQRLLSMVDDLLLVSRVDDAELSLDPVATALAPMVEAAISAILPTARARGVDLRVELPPLPDVLADPTYIDRVLLNILSNAIKFTLPDGHVLVTAALGIGLVSITVRDDGIGIAEVDRGRLFERFFRGSAASEREIQGSGLGLFVVQHIIEEHGGSVSVSSTPDVGTDVRFTLPTAPGSG